MDTNKIKKFAVEARNILKIGIAAKISILGFNKKGEVIEAMRPVLVQGGCIWNGRTETEGFYHRWMSLYNRIQQKDVNEVYEEASYTWFNRLVAIRILQKNGLAEPVLDFADAARTPRIVDESRSGSIPQMPEEMRTHLMELLDDDTKTTEQFALLITAWCHQNSIIEKCFGGMADYTELLLPNNILAEGGFLDMLNNTEFIANEDFESPELIGWLYQFYISERKDEVFAKKGKFEADEIPAATQIFTPNWIVKYMVQNTVGRIYLDNNPHSTAFKEKWHYLVDGEPTPEENKYRYEELTDLKVADLACGSGHILNECFDILYDLYVSEGYTRSEAIENIFRHNLTGIDLDKRAQQLATFALLLKACQKDRSYTDAHCLPSVLTMPKLWNTEKNGSIVAAISQLLRGCETGKMVGELKEAFELMKDADSLGSIMKFDISDTTRFAIKQAVEYWEKENLVPDVVSDMMPYMLLILALTEKYSAVVMNPPYMGGGNMNGALSKYVKENYKEGKADLFSVFMYLGMGRLDENGKQAQINMQSWMFLSSFEKLRTTFLTNYHLENMLHLGPRTFDELSGEIVQNTAFIISNHIPLSSVGGVYYNLIEGANCSEKQQLFLKQKNRYNKVIQQNFSVIPGNTCAYWLNSKYFQIISSSNKLGVISEPRAGLQTSDNNRFLRLWFEVDNNRVGYGLSRSAALSSTFKWFPHNKGGETRKWYGNRDFLCNFENDGVELKFWLENNPNDPTTKSWSRNLRNYPLYFNEGLTWGAMSNNISVRYSPQGSLFDTSGPMLFSKRHLFYILGFTNSIVFSKFLEIYSQGLSKGSGHFANIPFILKTDTIIVNLSQQNITISRQDWDAHETSWDFQENELIALSKTGLGEITATINDEVAIKYKSLPLLYTEYVAKWRNAFMQLHANEEELNRQFIEIYGLQDELTPDVPLNEITILQQGEVKINGNELEFQADVVMKQLISYAIGCWMGRYRLDQPGLYIAHPDAGEEEIVTYNYGDETLTIDDDRIIPLLPRECPFDDNLQNRISDFIRIAFGADSLAENLNFIEQSLGTSLEKYLEKEYWKNHKKMYKNRPIYWLWSSKKGAFRVISYMHRMDAYTAERIRSKYLLPYIEYLQNRITELEARVAQLSSTESRKLDMLRKTLEECREYHEHLQVVAERAIAFDLDDGVVVNYAKFGNVLAKIK